VISRDLEDAREHAPNARLVLDDENGRLITHRIPRSFWRLRPKPMLLETEGRSAGRAAYQRRTPVRDG
jgi:hypothetical protein